MFSSDPVLPSNSYGNNSKHLLLLILLDYRLLCTISRVPPDFTRFVLVDDAGVLLAKGSAIGKLPYISERAKNYHTVGVSTQ